MQTDILAIVGECLSRIKGEDLYHFNFLYLFDCKMRNYGATVVLWYQKGLWIRHSYSSSDASLSAVKHFGGTENIEAYILTPCSSSLRSCSGTFGELSASLRHWMLSSGITYSSTSFSGRPRVVPCLAVDGMASSRMAPRSVVSWKKIQKSQSLLVRLSHVG